MIKQEKVYPPLLNLIARGAMDKEKVIHEIKRDLRSPMVFRGLLIMGMFFLMIIYQVFCWFTYCYWIEHKDIRIWFSKSNISFSLGCSHLAANGSNSGHPSNFLGDNLDRLWEKGISNNVVWIQLRCLHRIFYTTLVPFHH